MGLFRVGLSLVVGWWALPAFAQDAVRWDAADGCPSAVEAKAQIAGLTAAPVDGAAEVPSAEVVIRRSANGEFEARITLGSGAHSQLRVLRDVQCAALSHAAAVVVALASERARRPEAPPPSAAKDPDAKRSRASGAAPSSARAGEGATPRGGTSRASTSGNAPGPSGGGSRGGVTSGDALGPSPGADTGVNRGAAAEPSSSANRVEEEAVSAPAGPTAPGASPVGGAADDQPPAETAPFEPRAELEPDDGDKPDSPLSAAEPHSDSPVAVQITLAGALSAGLVPNLAPLVAAGAGVAIGPARVGLRFAYAPAQRASLANVAGLGGTVGLVSLGLEGGLGKRFGAFELPLVAGIEAGLFSASSRGLPESDSLASMTPWLAVRLGSGVTWWFAERIGIGLRLEGIVSLLRPRFALLGPDGMRAEFYRPERVSGRALLQSELRFP